MWQNSYTLVLVKSAGNRRFGGFTTKTWDFFDPSHNEKDEKNAFLFSLDKNKIYFHINDKNSRKAIKCAPEEGPIFKYGFSLGDNSIKEKALYTYESYSNTNSNYASYDFDGDNNALSEFEAKSGLIYATEYEVFQVIFK